MPEDYFGERVAERFDKRHAHQADAAVVGPIADFLAGLARGGAALELATGTGRIALPLAQRGHTRLRNRSVGWSRGRVRSRARSRSV